MHWFKKARLADAVNQPATGEIHVLSAPGGTLLHPDNMSADDFRSTLRFISGQISDIICELKKEKFYTQRRSEDLLFLFDNAIWRLEDLRSLCDQI